MAPDVVHVSIVEVGDWVWIWVILQTKFMDTNMQFESTGCK